MLPYAACPTLEVWAVENHPPEVVWGLNGKSEISGDQNDITIDHSVLCHCSMCKSFVPKATGAFQVPNSSSCWRNSLRPQLLFRPIPCLRSAAVAEQWAGMPGFEKKSSCLRDQGYWHLWSRYIISCSVFNVCHWWSCGSFLAAALRPEEFKAMLGISHLEMSLVWAIISADLRLGPSRSPSKWP